MTAITLTQKSNRIIDTVFWLVAAAVALLAAGSFVLSFNALIALATANGVPAHLAFIWPLVVDLSLVIYAASILTYQLLRVKPIYPIALTGFYGAVTIVGNLLHSPAHPIGWFVAALPPVSLLLATELLRELAKQKIDRLAVVDSLTVMTAQAGKLTAEVDRLTARRDKLSGQVDELKQPRKQAYNQISESTKEAAKQILAERPGVSGAELGRLLEKSDSTGRRLKRELVNGNGYVAE